jgi:hypothetical protein
VDSEEDDRIEMMIETKLCSIFSSVNLFKHGTASYHYTGVLLVVLL